MTDVTGLVPRLISSYRGFNLVAVGERFCAAHQALGPLDLYAELERSHPDLIWAKDEAGLRARIDAARLWRRYDPMYSEIPLEEFGPPEVIEIEPIYTCNLRCIMCHVSYDEPTKQRIDVGFLDHLRGLEGRWAKLGSLYEPVAHPEFDKIARGLTERGLDIDLVTNGTLFTPALIGRIQDCNFANVTISFDGIRPATYERIRRRAEFATAVERIRAFRDAVKARNPACRFQINYTVLRSNIDEIPEAVDFWEAEGFDHIGFIAMVKRDENALLQEETVEPALDRLTEKLGEAARRVVTHRYRVTLSSPEFHNSALKAEFPNNVGVRGEGLVVSDHPGARLAISPSTSFQKGHYPGMSVGCRSPFKFARIGYDGNVYLCYLFSIGSIYEADLLDLWTAKETERVRNLVKQDAYTCYSCEYFRFCIKSNDVDYGQAVSFASDNDEAEIGRTWRYRFLRWRGMYYAIPRGHGGFSPDVLVDPQQRAQRCILRNSDLAALRRNVSKTALGPRTIVSGVLYGVVSRLERGGDGLAQELRQKGATAGGVSQRHRYWKWNGDWYAVPRHRRVRFADLRDPAERAKRGVLAGADLDQVKALAKDRWPGWAAFLIGALRALAAWTCPKKMRT